MRAPAWKSNTWRPKLDFHTGASARTPWRLTAEGDGRLRRMRGCDGNAGGARADGCQLAPRMSRRPSAYLDTWALAKRGKRSVRQVPPRQVLGPLHVGATRPPGLR